MTELEQMYAAETNELWHNPIDPGKGIIAGLSRIRWASAAGILNGTVKSVDYGKNAAGDMIPWMVIGDIVCHECNSLTHESHEKPYSMNKDYTTRLALTRTNLARLKAEVLN